MTQNDLPHRRCRLMTSWMVVADVYFLEPQTKAPGESTIAFAQRVQSMIAQK